MYDANNHTLFGEKEFGGTATENCTIRSPAEGVEQLTAGTEGGHNE
jgi:hypothetical protein